MDPPVVVIRPPTEETRRLWSLVLDLAAEFGSDREWSLIGGLMVQLHGFEHDDDPRPTADIDLLAGAKRPPRMTEEMAELLVGRGAEISDPPRSDPRLGYRFEIEGEIVELLGPDGLRHDPKTTAGLKTFRIEGGSQALHRTEVVLVSLDGEEPVAVRRPSLLGAILIKGRVVAKRREVKYFSDRQDLIRLLTYVDDPRALAADVTRTESKRLRLAETAVDFEDPSLAELFDRETLGRARQALRLLAQES
jgi:hypothetical protein